MSNFANIEWKHSIPKLSGTLLPPKKPRTGLRIPPISQHDLETEIMGITTSYWFLELWSSLFQSRDRGVYFLCSNVWKRRQSQMWFTSVGTHSTQRYYFLFGWCRSVRRQRTLGFPFKPGCHCSCYQNTFTPKTVQHSAMQSGRYWLSDRFDSPADICCVAFHDSPHPWILRSSGWNASSFYRESVRLRWMVLRQYHPD